MRHGDEQAQVLEWLYGVLSTDPVLAQEAGVPVGDLPDRVWPEVAPADTSPPWLVYSTEEALDREALGPHPRLSTVVPLNVRWITRSADPGSGAAAARRLYALLVGNHNVPVAGGGLILTCRRTSALNYGEDAGGVQYRHQGHLLVAEVN